MDRLRGRRIPKHLSPDRWFSSPLRRAVQTAQLLGCAQPIEEPLLMEMNWGEWEGKTLAELRGSGDMQSNEDRGLDFEPEGGETPRAVRHRFSSWLGTLSGMSGCTVAVTHKGVIRAALSLATEWDMVSDPPYKLRWDCAHRFRLSDAGYFTVAEVNLELEREAGQPSE